MTKLYKNNSFYFSNHFKNEMSYSFFEHLNNYFHFVCKFQTLPKLYFLLATWINLSTNVTPSYSQQQFTAIGTAYTENFNTLSTSSNTWADNSTISGWYVSTNPTLTVGTGSSLTGTCYNFGASGNTDRSIGALSSGSASPSFGVRIRNNTGQSISMIHVSYFGERWRLNTGTDGLVFSYQTGTTVTSLSSGTWTSLSELNFSMVVGTAGALDGNLNSNRQERSATIILSTPLANGEEIFLRWSKTGSNSQGLAVDDLIVRPINNYIQYPLTSNYSATVIGTAIASDAVFGSGTSLQGVTSNGMSAQLTSTYLPTSPASNSYFEYTISAPICSNLYLTNVKLEDSRSGAAVSYNVFYHIGSSYNTAAHTQIGGDVTIGSSTPTERIFNPTSPLVVSAGSTIRLRVFGSASAGRSLRIRNISIAAYTISNDKTVIFNGNGATSGSMADQTACSTTNLTSNAFTRTGYIFSGWNTVANGSGTSYANGASFPFTANTTLYAQWTANTLTITYDSQGGSAISNGTTTTRGTVLDPGNPTRSGYIFNGWFIASSGGSAISFPYTHNQTTNFTLFAQWTANSYTVTFDGNGGGTPSPTSISVTYASTYGALATVSRSGYAFSSWNTAADGTGSTVTASTTVSITSAQMLYAQWTLASSPIISGAATATAFTTTYGTASASQSFSVSGSALTNDINVTVPTGFEVSTDNSTYGSTATFTQSGGSASGTLYVRLAATATVSGSYNSQNIALTSSGASTVNIATAASGNTVTAKGLTITGISISNKTYDGNTTATISGTAAYSGLVNGETFSVAGTAIASFGDKTVSNGKAVTVSGYTAPSANYSITQPTGLTANITSKSLIVSGAAVSSKVYDGTNAATITGSLSGVISGDVVNLVGSGTFASANVGTGISVTSTSTLNGADAANYSLTQPTGLTANITTKALTITANNVTKEIGTSLTGGSSPTAFTSSGLVGGQTIGSVTIAYGTGAATTDGIGTYTGQVTASAATGGTFIPGNYSITYIAGNIIVQNTTSVILSALGTAATEDFNSLASSGTSSTTPTGWYFSETGSNSNSTYTAGTGSSSTGETYSFGATSDSERAFGTLLSGSLIPTIGAKFINNTGSTINNLFISYTGETWRVGATGRADKLDFQYSTNATSLTTGTWTNFDGLDYENISQTATASGRVIHSKSISDVITSLSIANGSTFWIRWNDFDVSGSDDGMAIDDISIKPCGSVSAPTASDQTFCATNTPTLANLNATGTDIKWYAAASGGAALASSIALVNGTSYFATQTISGCENITRTAVAVTVNPISTTTQVVNTDYIWTGKTSTDLNTASNWLQFNTGSYTTVSNLPSSTINVIIPARQTCVSNQPNTNNNNITVKNLTIESGAIFTAGSSFIYIYGDFINNGLLDISAGTVFLSGSNNILGGTSLTAFNNLNLNGVYRLNNSSRVTGTLTLSNGKISLGDYNLSLTNATGLSGGSPTAYIVTDGNGSFQRAIGNPGTYFFPLGSSTDYNPASVSWNAAPGVTRLDAKYIPNTASGTTGLPISVSGLSVLEILDDGYWDISIGAGTLNNPYDITLTRNGHSNAGIAMFNHAIIKRNVSSTPWILAGTWANPGSNLVNSTDQIQFTQTAVPGFSQFAIAKSDGVLPITLSSFTGFTNNNINQLKWITQIEQSSSHFEIERSADAVSFEKIGSINASGISNLPKQYLFNDLNPIAGLNYYRLKMVDMDATYEYSHTIALENKKSETTYVFFPNPTHDFVNYQFNSEINESLQIEVLNTLGQTVFSQTKTATVGTNSIAINLADLVPGAYTIRVKHGALGITHTEKIFKK
jgi:uncharacterized repeat protein (TIGR02543 family)